jgi:hypothetical protein
MRWHLHLAVVPGRRGPWFFGLETNIAIEHAQSMEVLMGNIGKHHHYFYLVDLWKLWPMYR